MHDGPAPCRAVVCPLSVAIHRTSGLGKSAIALWGRARSRWVSKSHSRWVSKSQVRIPSQPMAKPDADHCPPFAFSCALLRRCASALCFGVVLRRCASALDTHQLALRFRLPRRCTTAGSGQPSIGGSIPPPAGLMCGARTQARSAFPFRPRCGIRSAIPPEGIDGCPKASIPSRIWTAINLRLLSTCCG
jgi:hypothetical protein